MICKAIGRKTALGRSRNEKPEYSAKCTRRSTVGFCIALVAALAIAAPPALALSNYVPPIVTTANTTLFSNSSAAISPGQVAVDKAGNVFYVSHASPFTLFEIPYAAPAVTVTTPVTLITGLGQYNSNGLFVDPKGNLWIANGNGTGTPAGGSNEYIGLIEIPALNGIPNTGALTAGGETVGAVAAANCTAASTVPCVWQDNTFATNITNYYAQPSSLYVDGSGNVYFVDYYDGNTSGAHNRIVKFNLSSPGTGTLLADSLTSNNLAQIALDGAGNLYYADNPNGGGNGTVNVVSGGALTPVGASATIASAQIASATGVSSDAWGNLYISSGAQLSEVPFEGTSLNFADEFGIVSGLSSTGITYGGAVDSNGNYYYAYNSASATKIQQLQINSYNFGSVNIGTLVTGPSLTLYFNAAESSLSSYFPTGSPTGNTNPALLQSFPYSGTKSFAGGASFTPGQTGTITMNFQPIHPGLLKGSFTPRSGGVNDAIINLQGVGAGPQPMFLPGVASSLFTSAATSSSVSTPVPLNGPTGIAVDTFGDIFVTDTGNGKVVADCLSTTTANVSGNGSTTNSFCGNTGYIGTVVELGTGFTKPAAIALDGANNLYVVDGVANSVTLIQGVNLASTTPITSTTTFGGTALNTPKGIAVDGYTNIYIADTGNNRIVQAHQYGATATNNTVYISSTTTFGGTALNRPTGIGLDSAGNLFIADTGNNRVVEYTPLGVASVVTTTGITLNAPTDVKVLPSGTLVVTDSISNVSLISNGTGTTLPIGTFAPNAPQGVAFDLAGNIYISDTGAGRVLELAVSSPASDSFPTTAQGSSSAAIATNLVNTGSAALSFSAIASANSNFIIGAGTCATTATVAAAASCTLLPEFTPPTSGPLTGSITLTDNQLGFTLNTTGANEVATFTTSGARTIAVSGTATAVTTTPQTISFPAPLSPVVYGVGPITLSATATSGLPVTFSVISGPGVISGTSLTLTGIGTVVINASQPGNGTYSAAPSVPQSVVVNAATSSRPPIVLSQLSWLGAISSGGFNDGALPTGGSFAVNKQGNAIVSNTYGSSIYLYNGTTGAVTTLSPSGGFSNPGGVTIDANNNLYISRSYNNNILKAPYVNGAYVTITDTFPANCTGTDTTLCIFANPGSGTNTNAMAFDSAGNFYMVSVPNGSGSSSIYECNVACQPAGTPTLIYTDPNPIGSIAIDPNGNIFFTDAVFSSISNLASTSSALNELKYTPGTGFAASPIVLETLTVGTPGNYDNTLGSVGTDAAGTVYYADQNNGLYALPNNHGTVDTANRYGISPQGTKNLTLDASGNIYLVAYHTSGDAVGKILVNNLAVPPTVIGTTTTTTGVTVMDNFSGCSSTPTITFTATEGGAATSEFSAVTTGSCAGQAVGSDFAATITFSPTVTGNRSALFTVADTTNGGVGTATVTGLANPVPTTPQTITFTPPTTPSAYSTTPINLTATASSGLAVTFSVVSGPATVSGNALTLTGIGTVVVAANQPGNTSYAAATQVTQSIVVTQASQTITFTATTTPVTFSTTPINLAATASSGLTVAFTVTSGPATISGTALTLTGAGTVVIAANQAGNTNYTAAPAVSQTIVVSQAAQTITFAAPTTPVTFSTTPINLTATASSGLAVTFTVTSGPGTISGTALSLTGAGTVVIAANQAGNTNYAAATVVSHSLVVNTAGVTAAPTFTPAAGTYSAAQSVVLASTTPGAVFYYTTDGSLPTINSTVYKSSISVASSQIVQAVALAPGYTLSSATTASYTINIVPPSFTIAINPSALTIPAGSLSGTVGLTVTPISGFNSAVSFACSGLPSGSSCAFTPATVTPTAGPGTTAFTVNVPFKSSALRPNSTPLLPGTTIALALCLFGWRKRRAVRVVLLLAIGIVGLSMVTACGTTPSGPTTANVTVTATSGTISQTTTLSLTMQ
jgi:sugar lactone lactonase YvrE